MIRSVAINPVKPDISFAGTRQATIWRSHDGGRKSEKLSVAIVRECSIGPPLI